MLVSSEMPKIQSGKLDEYKPLTKKELMQIEKDRARIRKLARQKNKQEKVIK